MDKSTFNKLVRETRLRMRIISKSFENSYGSNPAEMIAKTYSSAEGEEFLSSLIERSDIKRAAWDTTNLIAQKLLRKGEQTPPELAEWVADLLAGKRSIPSGPNPGTHFVRNITIYIAIRWLETKKNIPPTRNDEKKSIPDKAINRCCYQGGSGCDIVGMAVFEECGDDLTYGRTKDLFLNVRKMFSQHEVWSRIERQLFILMDIFNSVDN